MYAAVCFRNRRDGLQPGVFNFDRNVVRQGSFGNAAKEQKNKVGDRN